MQVKGAILQRITLGTKRKSGKLYLSDEPQIPPLGPTDAIMTAENMVADNDIEFEMHCNYGSGSIMGWAYMYQIA